MEATRAPGSDGVYAYGGFLVDVGERRPALVGSNQWVTYDNLIADTTVIAAAVGIWLDLAGSSKWEAAPNKAGGADAVRAAEIVQEGLIGARMPTRWRSVVKKQAMKRFRGFALHAKGWRRRDDGLVVLSELAHRPQHTIERWTKPLETEPWEGVVQRSRSGAEFPIARRDLFYSQEGAIGESPQGVGLLRHLVKLAEIFDRYLQLQGLGFDTDLNGVPLPRAPLDELFQEGDRLYPGDQTKILEHVMMRTAEIRKFAEQRVRTPNKTLLLESMPYFADNAQTGQRTPSTVFKWSVDMMRQATGALPDLAKALAECNHLMAIVLSAEHLLMGSAGTSGAYAASADKTSLFTIRIDSSLDDLSDDAERDIIPDLLARNGITDERLFPELQHQSVARSSAKQAAEMLKMLADAKLKPGDPAENVLRAREELPAAPEPDDEDIAAWRSARSASGGPSDYQGEGAPAAGEEDEQ
jgi:hypothetical protein